ncbi:MAG: hypothetical protein L6R40_000408 [Gallowayella cf. fulva]|nr:MAG: hypothetical protein L6R40_000408 [Xanthomendoza cf. fulva]
MAQGLLKKNASGKAAPKRPAVLGPKKGARTIAPRKKKLVDQKKLTKKYSAGLIRKTESSLAEKAGHLEMLRGGKKSKKGNLEKKGKGK